MSKTLIDVLSQAARVDHDGYTFLDNNLEPTAWSFKRLADEADRRAAYFLSLGCKPGDRIAMVVPDGEDFVLSFLGAVRGGLVPVPMYPPLALGKIDSYVDTAARIIEGADARLLITSKRVAPILWSLVGRVQCLQDILLTDKVRTASATQSIEALQSVAIRPEDPCFLQFTSGSTSEPKGVVVTHGNLVANAKAIMIDGLDSHSDTDRGVSWLPLYHDMGLIGFVVAPLLNQVPVVFIPTLAFVKRPTVWMETVNKYRGTITFGPNFALGLAAKRATDAHLAKLDLSCLRVLGCGAEPINPATMRTFVEKFGQAGFNPNALMPAYGMAEATLAISFDSLQHPFTSVRIDRDAYENTRRVVPLTNGATNGAGATLELVSCGQTFPEHEIAVVNDEGAPLPPGEVGEIVVKGPSVTAGYFANEDATRDLLRHGWLHTGDLGFLHEGQLYISGRIKDLIILNGRNYYPQSIEWEVEQVDGVRKGNVVAFSVRGETTEELVIAAETKAEDRSALGDEITTHLKSMMGVQAADVKLVGPGQLPKTSSGKIQRSKTKSMYEQRTLESEGIRTLGSTTSRLALAKHVAQGAIIRIRRSFARPARRLFRSDRRP